MSRINHFFLRVPTQPQSVNRFWPSRVVLFCDLLQGDGPNGSAPQGIDHGKYMGSPYLDIGTGLAPLLAGWGEIIVARENFEGPHVWHNRSTLLR